MKSETVTEGWRFSQLWDDLINEEIFELPDSSQLKGEERVYRRCSYVLEYRRGPNIDVHVCQSCTPVLA